MSERVKCDASFLLSEVFGQSTGYCYLQNSFRFASTNWTDKTTFNVEGGNTGFDFKEARLATYWSSSFNQACLGTTSENQNTFIFIYKTADSMFSLIADNVFRATSLGRDTWKKWFGDKGSL